MFFLQACPASPVRRLDQQLFSLVNGLEFPGSDYLLGWVTWIGDAGIAAVIAVLALLLLDRRRFWSNFLFIAGALLISTLFVQLLKTWVGRPRPLIELGGMLLDGSPMRVMFKELTQRGFPSGHTQTVFGLAAGFHMLFAPRLRWLYFIALWVGVSRMYVGAHFPLDILAGGLLGVLGVDLMAKIWRPAQLRVKSPEAES